MANKFRIDYEGKNDNIKEEVESIRNSYLEKTPSQKKQSRQPLIENEPHSNTACGTKKDSKHNFRVF